MGRRGFDSIVSPSVKRLLIPLVLLVAPLASVLASAPAVVVRDADTGHAFLCGPAPGGQDLTLTFSHSMYGGLVEETFEVDGDDLVRTGVRAERAAAAEYYGMYGDVLADAGWFRVIVTPLPIRDLRFVADEIGHHEIRIGSKGWRTGDSPPPLHVSVRVEDISPGRRREWDC